MSMQGNVGAQAMGNEVIAFIGKLKDEKKIAPDSREGEALEAVLSFTKELTESAKQGWF